MQCWRFCIECITAVILALAFALTASALLTPQWQIADMQQLGEIHHHGLWRDCVYGSRATGGANKEWECAIKLYGQEKHEQEKHGHHHAEDWRLVLIVLLSVACFSGLFALIPAVLATCVSGCQKRNDFTTTCGTVCLPIFMLIATAVSFFTSAAAAIIFLRKSQDLAVLYILEITNHAKQEIGISYWLCVAGAVAYFIALLATLAVLTLVCIGWGTHQKPSTKPIKTWPKSNLNTQV